MKAKSRNATMDLPFLTDFPFGHDERDVTYMIKFFIEDYAEIMKFPTWPAESENVYNEKDLKISWMNEYNATSSPDGTVELGVPLYAEIEKRYNRDKDNIKDIDYFNTHVRLGDGDEKRIDAVARQLDRLQRMEVGVYEYVVGHELGHQWQFMRLGDRMDSLPVPVIELDADVLGSFSVYCRERWAKNLETLKAPSYEPVSSPDQLAEGAAAEAFELGDNDFTNPDHHGTSVERKRAAELGAQLARDHCDEVDHAHPDWLLRDKKYSCYYFYIKDTDIFTKALDGAKAIYNK